MLDPGSSGHIALFNEVQSNDGQDLWVFDFHNGRSVSIPKGTQIGIFPTPDFAGPIHIHKTSAAIPAYLLTQVGEAISSIFPPNDAAQRYVDKLREALPNVELTEYELQADGSFHSINAKNANANGSFISTRET